MLQPHGFFNCSPAVDVPPGAFELDVKDNHVKDTIAPKSVSNGDSLSLPQWRIRYGDEDRNSLNFENGDRNEDPNSPRSFPKIRPPFAGSRLLLLDTPGNIHSVSFLLKLLTGTYFDVFATFPPILPPGPLGILGFGAGSAAKLILELYPQGVVHGWELDPAVISVGREYFGLSKLERQYPDRLFIYVGNALNANIESGFSGLLVDLFSKGCLIPELQDPDTWMKMKKKLREGGRIMVNVGGSCVEAEDLRRDGKMVMEETLKAMEMVFPGEVCVLDLGSRKDDSSIAVTGKLPDLDSWKKHLPKSLRFYVDMWKPFTE
ncbi:hypothetical protein L1987_66790 [Smallanthus sonchifolius]|uniref:Uncharacterized protein n=1 Tax=Smallanthus sonchifolius TaxID=185202 RepID=A0ACB9BYE4_9ASTR|nr:hypothetical protein L1987_66790 [Smallanthus sonchifolius]